MNLKTVDVDKLRTCLYGMAVGDALGVPYEFRERGSFVCTDMVGYGTWNQPKGTYSDDTGMALAMLDSIAECGGIDTNDMMVRFRLWFGGEYMPNGLTFDVGNTVRSAIAEGKGMDGLYDNGNGSLMRTAPLALLGCTDEEVMDVSAVTHAHRIAKESCLTFVRLLEDVISEPDETKRRIWRTVWNLDESEVPSNAFVVNTLTAALWCFAHTNSYEECVLKAVNMGKDTDTTACVVGALAALAYGFDSIPKRWVNELRGRDIIDGILAKFGQR